MATHPLWRPFELADLDEAARAQVGEQPPRVIRVTPYDDTWPAAYATVATRIREALGARILALDHVGSTSVAGLAAKPVLDIDLVVADPADEDRYVPDLVAAGFVLRLREPGWWEHRLLVLDAPETNLHVLGPDATEPARHRMFRDHLRRDPTDREAYAQLKTELGRRTFRSGMDYNNHKAALVYDLYEHAFTADPEHPHDPHPRPA